MAEWLKAHAWKACVRETVPWVRIPLSPPAQRRSLCHSWPKSPKTSIKTAVLSDGAVRETRQSRRLGPGDAAFLQSFVLRRFSTVFKSSNLRCLQMRARWRFESLSEEGVPPNADSPYRSSNPLSRQCGTRPRSPINRQRPAFGGLSRLRKTLLVGEIDSGTAEFRKSPADSFKFPVSERLRLGTRFDLYCRHCGPNGRKREPYPPSCASPGGWQLKRAPLASR